MPRRPRLTEVEMAVADQLHASGMSNIKIAKQLERSEKVIRTYINDLEEYRRVKQTGRQKKLVLRQKDCWSTRLPKENIALHSLSITSIYQ